MVPTVVNLKGVAFYGREGQIVGFRVTGIRPGSWGKRLGLRPGDVIETASSGSDVGVDVFRARLAEGWEPSKLKVLRGVGASARRLTLQGS